MVALYARVSTDEQQTENQVMELKKWAEQQGLKYEVYQENASAKGTDRVELQRMMSKVDKGRYKAVVVWKLDRFSRSMRDFVKLFDRLQKANCGLVAITQGIDTRDGGDANSRMIINLMAVFAEWEREMIVERTKLGLARAKREGKRLGRPKVQVNVMKAFRLWMAGNSIRDIAERMKVKRSTLARKLKAFNDSCRQDGVP